MFIFTLLSTLLSKNSLILLIKRMLILHYEVLPIYRNSLELKKQDIIDFYAITNDSHSTKKKKICGHIITDLVYPYFISI